MTAIRLFAYPFRSGVNGVCGICGIFNRDGSPVDLATLKAMNNALIHRGPDGEGYFTNTPSAVPKGSGPAASTGFPSACRGYFPTGDALTGSGGFVGLGHRRLAIIDLHTGDQPLSNEDHTVWVVFNGEIYNFQELREHLQSRGHHFRTRSDTEVIVHGWEEWGEAMVERLRGMFAIALWDEKRRALWLARDRLGKKPLYYALDHRRIVFASELKAIQKLSCGPFDLDLEALDLYLSFGYVPAPRSIFRQVRKLEPAQWALCTAEDFTVRTYWQLTMEAGEGNRSDAAVAAELLDKFDESVKLRLVSDVPLGAFLSGGVDSSAVVASMALQQPQEPVTTTSIGFSEKRYDELRYARMVAERYRTDHHEEIVSPNALNVLDRIVYHFDEPFADSSAIPTWYVSQMARRHVTVALSGDGGDETFAGYVQRYAMCRLEDRWRRKLPESLRVHLLGPIARRYPRLDGWPRPLRLKGFLTNLSLNFDDAYCRDLAFYFKPEAKRALYKPDVIESLRGIDCSQVMKRHLREARVEDPVSRAQYADIKFYMPEDILVKVDRMSMAHSLEVRSPILDHELMELVAALPSRFKLNGSESKYIFKKINEPRLPREILYRKKQGFVVPLARWLRSDLAGLVEETLLSRDALIGNYFRVDAVRNLWLAHRSGRYDNAAPLWNLMMLELWHSMFSRKA